MADHPSANPFTGAKSRRKIYMKKATSVDNNPWLNVFLFMVFFLWAGILLFRGIGTSSYEVTASDASMEPGKNS